MMYKYKIAYAPLDETRNSYTLQFSKILKKFGKVESVSYSPSVWFTKKVDFAIINWPEDAFVAPKTGNPCLTGIAKTFTKLLILKFRAKKIIYVQHNYYPHSTKDKWAPLIKWLISIYRQLADQCWVHSGITTIPNSYYIPHPAYSSQEIQNNELKALSKDTYVVFGRVLRYKKIDILLNSLPKNIKLVICGDTPDNHYLDELIKLATPNVTIYTKPLNDNEAAFLIKNSMGVIVCHSSNDMIASGSIVFALSAKSRVFALKTEFTTWLKNSLPDNVIYDYTTISELTKALSTEKPPAEIDFDSAIAHFSSSALEKAIESSFQKLT